MGYTFLCVLGIFSLSILFYCGCAQDFVLTVEPNWSTLFTGESVTLIWDMREGEGTDWHYTILKDGQEYLIYSTPKMSYTLPLLSTRHSGEYQCFGRHKRIAQYQKKSNKVSLTVAANDVILENPASTLYEGESVTLRCRHRTQEKRNASFYKDGSLIEMDTNQQRQIISENAVEITIRPLSDGSSYMCKFDEDEESQPIKLKMEANRPKAELRIVNREIPLRGNVTLKCSVTSSSGWKYFWYRGEKTSQPLTTQDVVFLSNETICVSKGGVYRCRGGRGNPVYYTEYSNPIATNRPVVTLQPSWPKIYYGEMITLRCEIENGEDTEWKYEWSMYRSYTHTHTKKNENVIRFTQSSQTGQYMCLGRTESEMSTTQWSDPFILTLSDKPLPVLTVSPLWLNDGDSVTLNCEVEHPSAGWRFYWYKAVPNLSDNSYSPELLPGSSNGTEQDSYIVHGQTGTAGYVCRAGRGDPVYYIFHSQPKFVWSGDFRSSASLIVSPDRVQHFTSDSVSLNCEGNSTVWRVIRFTGNGYPLQCFYWGTMTGSTCNIKTSLQSDAVYWCESGSGEFSNAVNISIQYKNIILLSPGHPVTEGDPVSLTCKLRTGIFDSNVFFYRNDELIQNDTRKELNISAVSKSDEGFYKCQYSGEESSQSWLSVKVSRPESSSFPVLLILGLVCGIVLLLLLLLLLYHFRPFRDSCFRQIKSENTNEDTDKNHPVNQNETQHDEYSSPSHGGSQDVTYSSIELKNIKKEKEHEPEKSSVYANVKTGTEDDNLMYAQVNYHNKGKASKNKRKSRPAATDETVYSEVKVGTALDL